MCRRVWTCLNVLDTPRALSTPVSVSSCLKVQRQWSVLHGTYQPPNLPHLNVKVSDKKSKNMLLLIPLGFLNRKHQDPQSQNTKHLRSWLLEDDIRHHLLVDESVYPPMAQWPYNCSMMARTSSLDVAKSKLQDETTLGKKGSFWL